jgi:predicted transcriptional regulator
MLLNMNLASERRKLVFHIKMARTPEQVRIMTEAVELWLKKAPEDAIVKRAAQQLATIEAWLRNAGKWQ